MDNEKQIHIKLSQEQHKLLKIAAAINDKSIQVFVVELITSALESKNNNLAETK